MNDLSKQGPSKLCKTKVLKLVKFERKLVLVQISKGALCYLFPGFMAASVWIPPPIVTPVLLKISRLSPLITPTVSVWSNPNGFPIAKHCCPTFRDDDSPTLIGFKISLGASTCNSSNKKSNLEAKYSHRMLLVGIWCKVK